MKKNIIDNVYSYDYKHLKTFIATNRNDKNYDWHFKNLLGEVYESYVYELLIDKYRKEKNVRFVLKGPYVKNNFKKGDGLRYNKRNEIYYISDKLTIAEFDGIAIYHDKIRFFEISRVKKIQASRYREEIIRKISLLKLLFDKPVECIIVAPENKIINADICKMENISIPDIEYDWKKFASNSLDCDKTNTFIELSEIEPKCFRYFETMQKLYIEYSKSMNLRKYFTNIKEKYLGLLERMYLGKLNNKIYFLKIDLVRNKLELRWLKKEKNAYFEIKSGKEKKVSSIKRVVQDINKLHSCLVKIKDLVALQHRVDRINETL